MAGQLLDNVFNYINSRSNMKNKNEDFLKIDCTTYDPKITNIDFIDDQLELTIEDIDDLAIAWIVKIVNNEAEFLWLNKNPKETLEIITPTYPKWLWRPGGRHGAGTENITQWFHNNYNLLPKVNKYTVYLTIAVYDFPYDKWFLPGGKWSFSAELNKNGKTKWKKTLFRSSKKGVKGLQYLKIFSLSKKKKSFTISETIDENVVSIIKDEILEQYNYTKADFKKNKLIR